MVKEKNYVAIQDFSLSLDNGKSTLNVKRGEVLEFDGLNVNIRGQSGVVKPLAKVIGEWIVPATQKVVKVKNKLARPSRNVSGGRLIEHSDFSSDPLNVVQKYQDDSLETLVKKYEVPQKTEVTDDLADARKEVKVINDDDREVMKVSTVDKTRTNTNGVEIKNIEEKKKVLLSPDGMVVKETSYEEGKEREEDKKPPKLKVDTESEGKVVKVTSSGKSRKKKIDVSTLPENEIIETDIDLTETSYPAIQTTEVGSSTQAHIEKQKTRKKSAKKASKSASKKEVIMDTNGQDANIVSKVSDKTSSTVSYEDGIVSKVTVGSPGEMKVGEASFSSNQTDDPGVSITSEGHNLSELIKEEKNDVRIENNEVSIDDIDIKDLLSDVD
jgi:hypothetical protein